MRLRSIWILGLLVGLTGLTAVADPMGWFKDPPFECSGTDPDEKIKFTIYAWADGSVEAIIRPLRELSAVELPNSGSIKINEQEYKFAPREDKEGKWTFYASVPVRGIPLDANFTFSMIIKDGNGVAMLDEGFDYEFGG